MSEGSETREERAYRLNAEGANRAHLDGRHASRHPADRKFWSAMGCTGCKN